MTKTFISLELGGYWKSDSSFLTTEICSVAVYTSVNSLHSLKNQCRERGTFRLLFAQLLASDELYCAN